ncbi:MAG: DUF2306 domain-containing protein [Planctomycetaceae bacterium]|nr:DUF2306 domain-containing protein [Planctomycetaceae bacterium]
MISRHDIQLIITAARAWLGGLAALVIVAIGLRIVSTFGWYFPPNFRDGFLAGRDAYFWRSAYGVGFYLHIVGAPVALLCGLPQFSRLLLRAFPRLHRTLGKTYALAVLLAAAPGGLIMGFWSRGGIPAMLCFITMSVLVAAFTILAWRTALQRRFESHRKWMTRSYLLMISAVLLRLLDPALRRAGLSDDLSYQLSVWLSWVPSLVIFEVMERVKITKGPVIASH